MAEFMEGLARRARKYNGQLVIATQSIEDFYKKNNVLKFEEGHSQNNLEQSKFLRNIVKNKQINVSKYIGMYFIIIIDRKNSRKKTT
jgi:DNA/RNA endonuclease YhcR with UshA esterase domain